MIFFDQDLVDPELFTPTKSTQFVKRGVPTCDNGASPHIETLLRPEQSTRKLSLNRQPSNDNEEDKRTEQQERCIPGISIAFPNESGLSVQDQERDRQYGDKHCADDGIQLLSLFKLRS